MRGWTAVLVGISVAAAATAARAEEAKPADQPAEHKAVYTFKDQEELQEFSKLVFIKQNVLTRIAVLQAYAAQEASNLEQINGQLFLKFKLDPNKSYTLDAEKRVLTERPTPPPAPAAAVAPAAGNPVPAANSAPAASENKP